MTDRNDKTPETADRDSWTIFTELGRTHDKRFLKDELRCESDKAAVGPVARIEVLRAKVRELLEWKRERESNGGITAQKKLEIEHALLMKITGADDLPFPRGPFGHWIR